MIHVVKIDTLEGIEKLAFEHQRHPDNKRLRSSYFYRGMPDASYDLSTSLMRNCGHLASSLEMHLLENFIKYASIEDPAIDASIWKAMIVGQHHGLPTRLLDWTPSPIIALHFADSEVDLSSLEKRDCVIWRIDARELNKYLPEEYKKVLDDRSTYVFSVKSLTEITNSIEDYDKSMGSKSLVMIEPPSVDQRIVNQYSFFSMVPKGISNLEKYLDENTDHTVKYIIDRSLRWDLRDILDQLNMNERTIYPGLDGISKWIARHYYVKR